MSLALAPNDSDEVIRLDEASVEEDLELCAFLEACRRVDTKSVTILKGRDATIFKVRIANPESRGLYTLRVQCKEKAFKIEHSIPPDLYRIRAGIDYNRGEAVAAAARSQDRRIHAANVIKAFFQVATGVYARPSSSSSGSGSESGSDDDDDDDDDVAAPAPAEGMASARLPFRRHRRGAAVRLPSSSEDSG